MSHLQHVTELPPNFAEFVSEVADSLEAMYGPGAASHYRGAAEAQFRAAIQRSSVDLLGWFEGKRAVGLLAAVQRDLITQFSFLHVLENDARPEIVRRLITEAIRISQAGGVDAILAEYVHFTPFDDGEVYKALGFESVERELMMAPLGAPTPESEPIAVSEQFDQDDWAAAAEVIVESYLDHPGRRLHIEVRDLENACAFLEAVAENNYGPSRPEYRRWVRRNGVADGIIAGCEVAPRVGFILQVAVRPARQNQGIGRQLVREINQTFWRAGCTKVALGVTSDSPARRLYARLGFQRLRLVTAHVWWRA